MENFDLVGRGYEEPAGKEHATGEHVLEDLEFGTKEEAGDCYFFLLFFVSSLNSVICLFSLELKFGE